MVYHPIFLYETLNGDSESITSVVIARQSKQLPFPLAFGSVVVHWKKNL